MPLAPLGLRLARPALGCKGADIFLAPGGRLLLGGLPEAALLRGGLLGLGLPLGGLLLLLPKPATLVARLLQALLRACGLFRLGAALGDQLLGRRGASLTLGLAARLVGSGLLAA